MTPPRAGTILGWVVVLAVTTGCVQRRPVPAGGPAMGLYAGRIEHAGTTRRFRLLLYAAPPDRIHGEVLSPLGSTELILDGGQNRLAVTVPRERSAYVGPALPATLERILGVRLSLSGLVRGILEGQASGDEYAVIRSPGAGGLPARLEIRSGSTRLILELKRFRPLGRAASELGTAEPPAGLSVRPLEELDAEPFGQEPDPPAGR